MPGFTQSNTLPVTNGLTLIETLVTLLTSGGAQQWFTLVNAKLTTPTQDRWLLESNNPVDAYLSTNNTQKYRLLITANKTSTSPVNVTTATIAFGDATQLSVGPGGSDFLVAANTPTIQIMNTNTVPTTFRESNFRITLTDRGWALGIWPTVEVNNSANNVFCVFQRPVNPTTGAPKVEGKAPIFAMWHGSDNATNNFFWGVVRENDQPSSYLVAGTGIANSLSTAQGIGTTNRYNLYKISLDWAHPNLFDNSSHVVKFPYGFATYRHLYLDELDLLCFVNASAFASSQDVKITMYGESVQREYRTIWGDVSYGANIAGTSIPKTVSGSRIGILRVGGGI